MIAKKTHILFFLLVLCLLVNSISSKAQLANTSWPKYGQDLRFTGLTEFEGPDSAQINWIFSAKETEENLRGPAIGPNGNLYVGSFYSDTTGFLYKIDASGKLKWQKSIGAVKWPPTIGEDGTIYVTALSDPVQFDISLHAISPDGDIMWEKTLDISQQVYPPTIDSSGNIYAVSRENLYAYNADGTLKWKVNPDRIIRWSPTFFSGDSLLLPVNDGYVTYSTKGTKADKFNDINGNPISPITSLVDEMNLISTDMGFAVSIELDHQKKWEYFAGTSLLDLGGQSLGPNQRVYFVINEKLLAFTTEGDLRWQKDISHLYTKPAVDSSGTVYVTGVPNDTAVVYAYNPNSSLKWKYNTSKSNNSYPNSGPVIGHNQTLYVSIGDTLLSLVDKKETSISKPFVKPAEFKLNKNYPNPFNPTTQIEFSLPQASGVQLTVYDMLGRRVTTLVEGKRQAGQHSVTFNASNLSSGVYIYRLKTDGFSESRNMLLVK